MQRVCIGQLLLFVCLCTCYISLYIRLFAFFLSIHLPIFRRVPAYLSLSVLKRVYQSAGMADPVNQMSKIKSLGVRWSVSMSVSQTVIHSVGQPAG